MLEADRMLLADPAACRVWKWLEARFPGQHLSLEMNPTLDLGIDSLDWMTITLELEQAFGIVLDEPAASLRDLVVIASRAQQQLTPAEAVLPPEPGIFSRAGWYAANAIKPPDHAFAVQAASFAELNICQTMPPI